MRAWLCHVMAVVFVGLSAQAASLVLEIDAQGAGFSPGLPVGSLAAAGSAGCTFTPAVPGAGATFASSYYGAKAFVFDGSANSVMVGCAPPTEICGNNAWSWEIWVLNPSVEGGIESVFGWTLRDDWPDGNAGRSCMEFRYGRDEGNAVEHYGNNVQWGGAIPAVGEWHHVACVFDESGTERLYVDGTLRTQQYNSLRLRDDGFFYLGGVKELNNPSGWAWPFSGGIGKLSIYEGAISAGQIVADYLAGRVTYGQWAAPSLSVWDGAAGVPLAWETSGNWLGGVVGDGNRVFIENGGVAVLASPLSELVSLWGADGGLVLEDGAELAVGTQSDAFFGVGNGNTFDLTLTGGSLAVSNRIYAGYVGADATITVGGGAGPATLETRFASFGSGKDEDQGASGNGSLTMVIADNGEVTVREGWALLGRYAGGSASLTIEEGGRFNYTGNDGPVIGSFGADGVLTMNGGLMDIRYPGRVMLSEVDGTAVAYLNGGTISTRQFFNGGASAAASEVYFNGTLLTTPSNDGIWNYFQDVQGLYLMPGNAVLEVPNDWTMGVYTPFTDASGTSGGIVKRGSGFLRLYGENDFTGPMAVEGGGLFLQGDLPLPDTYAGAVSVADNAIIALQRDGGAGQLASLMDPLSVGRIGLYAVNAQDTIDLSLLPDVALEPLENFVFEGVLRPYDNLFTVALSNDFTFAGTLEDLPGKPGRIWMDADTPPRRVLTLASSNDISGLVLIEGGILQAEDAHALGTGPITLRNGAALCLNTQDITNPIAAAIIARITSDSYGCILLGEPCASLSLNFSGLPGLYLGARPPSLPYTGAFTPEGTTYRFGGGLHTEFSGDRGLEVGGLTDNGPTPRGVEAGLPGMVYLMGGNTYSGKTRITDGGIIYLVEDSALGTPPGSYVADHLTLDGGVLRPGGGANINVNANRGVTIGAGGGAFHPWGGANLNLYSPLAGSGTLTITDNGPVRFFSPANTFTGDLFLQLDRNGKALVEIGNGADFSWVSPQPVWGIGNGAWLVLNNDNAATFPTPIQGAVELIKRGGGVLTLTAANTYTFGTRLENGTLRLGTAGAVAHGEGARGIHTFIDTFLDVNGLNATLSGISGPGTVMDGAGGAATLTVGDGGADSVFTGALVQQLAYRKIGGGIHADFGTNPIASPTVEGGTLMVANLTRLQGQPLLAGDGATLSLKTFNGLPGAFIDLESGVGWEGWWEESNRWHLDTLDALNDVVDNTPNPTLCDSATLGLYFDYGNVGQHFPDGYADSAADYFAARWRGKFYAPVAGEYQFATASDDASVIYINGQKVVDNNYLQGWGNEFGVPNRRGGRTWLAKGFHDITIGFIECGGGQGLTAWGGLGGDFSFDAIRILPQMFLDSDEPLTPDGILANTLTVQVAGGADTWVEKVGLPPLIVASDNSATFSGTWAVRSGEARVVDGGDFGGAGVLVDAGATLAFGYTGNYIYGGDIRGDGALRHAGPGTLTLTGHNTYRGGTIIDQGTLRVEASGTLGGGPLVVNGTLELAFSGTVRQSDVMPVTTATGSGEIILLSGTLIADTMTSTVPVRVMDGAKYIAATPNPAEVALEGGAGLLGNSDALMINFSDQSLWQTNGAAGWISDGVARVTSTVPDTGTGTLILKEQISAALPWEATFTYTMADTTSGVPADGFSCFIHNDPSRGAGAIGGGAQGFAVAGIGTAFGFVLNIYFDPNPGPFYRFAWVENGVSLYDTRADDLNGVMPENGIPVNVRLTHDGAGLVTVTLTQNGNTYTDSRWFDIPAELNGTMGWFGFGGAVGGCNADQQISEMTLTTPLPHTTHLTDADLWTFTGSAQSLGGGVFQLTSPSGGHCAIYLRDKIDLNVPWRFSFLYHATPANGCADGFAVFAHNDPRGTTALGNSGGGRGYTDITPQAGLTGNIFGNNYFNWIINGSEDGDHAYNPNGITPRNGNLFITMEYDGAGLLHFILRQGNNVWVTTRAIDLADAFGSPDAWLGITAACGGETADQRVSEVSFTYWPLEYLYPAYATSVTVKPGPTDSTLYGSYLPPDVDAGTLTLYHGAALDILPNPRLATDTPYSVTFQSVVLHGAATVAMHNNGTGAGTLTFAHLHAEPGGSVALTGNVILPDNTLTVTVSPNMPRGLHLLADFTSAAGVDDTTTFILDPTDAPPRAKLIFRNGRLYLNTAQGTVLILR